jgi:oligopeptide transport system ATP-binding protein
MATDALLSVQNLRTYFDTRDGTVKAVDGVSFEIRPGETLGLVGESGCGKSVTAMSIMRLVPHPPGRTASGEIWFDGRDLLKVSNEQMRHIRGREIAMIFQDPMTSLNPVLTIGRQITEALQLHLKMGPRQARNRAVELLQLVGIPAAARRVDDYPHQFSGGMRQRVMIAMALSCNPKLLIADEPTTALDVTIQAQILDELRTLREESGTGIILVTHDLGVVADIADRVIVMYAGRVVEQGTLDDLFYNPQHPYTWGLLGSITRIDGDRTRRLPAIPGLPPSLMHPPAGCHFRPRCPHAFERCTSTPPLTSSLAEAPEHVDRCWLDVEEKVHRRIVDGRFGLAALEEVAS